jgi:hypothetical protein
MKFRIKNIHIKILIILTSALFFTTACNTTQVVDNPPPFLEIIEGPADGDVLTVNYVTFGWQGSDNSIEFKYRLLALDEDNFPTLYYDWSPYQKVNEVTFENLDESRYRFEVMARSDGQEGGPATRQFEINAFQGPSMSFFKSETEMGVGQTDSISAWLEDVDSISAVHLVVAFDPNYLQLEEVSKGSFVERENFELIIVPDFENTSVLDQVNQTGKIEINTAVLATLYTLPNKSLYGSGNLLTFKFRAIAPGNTKLNYTLIEFHTEDGREFSGNPPKEGVVRIIAK